MIIDEKLMQPPPPPYYFPPPSAFSDPPPAFSENAGGSNGGNTAAEATFSSLPAHLLLQVVYSTFPQQDGRYEGESKIERQRRNLHWLETSLRLVNKSLYIACMHILRSTYLPAYDSLIRAPYTSDPFSSTSPGSVRREIVTLDLFIALLAHEDVLLDATSLHLPREEAYKDLFDMVQPRSRLEDLLLEEGLRAGLVYVGNPPLEPSATNQLEPVVSAPICAVNSPAVACVKTENITPQPSPSPTKTSFNPFSRSSYISLAKSKMRRTPNTPPDTPPPPASPLDTATASSSSPKLKPRPNPLPFDSIGISFSPRRVALIYMPAVSSNGAYHGSTFGALSVSITGPMAAGGFKAKKTLVEVVRSRDEQLEVSAKRLIQGLEEVMSAGGL